MTILLLNLVPAAAAPAPHRSARAVDGVRTTSVITIGVGGDLSGPVNSIGWGEANSVQLAANEINAAGGISVGGITYTLAVVTADSACNAALAPAAANALLAAGAVAVVGHTCSGETNAAQPIYAAAGVPMISASATNPNVTQQGYTTTFRTISQDGTPPALLASYWHERAGVTRVAVVVGPGAAGSSTANAFAAMFTGLGGTVTSNRVVTTTAQYTATLTAIQAETPNGIFFDSYDALAAGQFSAVANNLGMTAVPIGWTSHSEDVALLQAYAGAAGAAAAGDDVAMYYRWVAYMPGWRRFLAAYQAVGFPNQPDSPGMPGAFAYDAARIIVSAMLRANSVAPAAIRNEIAATANYRGVAGLYQGFDAHGDVIPQWAWITSHRNGTWVVVDPPVIYLSLFNRNAP